MCTKDQVQLISNEIVDAYREVYGPAIQRIFLYGSYARGDYSDQSDIDYAAIVSGRREDLQDKLYLVWDKAADIGVRNDAVVSPIVIPTDEFEKYRNILPYYRNIEREGLQIG